MSDDAPAPPARAGPLPTPDFDAGDGLLPAVVQDAASGEVRMLGYMDRSALEQTVDTGRVTFYSRSRERHWMKGETSGNWLEAVEVRMDCDGDALLVRARPHGPTCHTGEASCFDAATLWSREGEDGGSGPRDEPGGTAIELGRVLEELAGIIAERDRERPEDSYTALLLSEGAPRAARKVSEEALELALSVVGEEGPVRQIEESADLLYHLLVLWRSAGLDADRVARELERRRTPSP